MDGSSSLASVISPPETLMNSPSGPNLSSKRESLLQNGVICLSVPVAIKEKYIVSKSWAKQYGRNASISLSANAVISIAQASFDTHLFQTRSSINNVRGPPKLLPARVHKTYE